MPHNGKQCRNLIDLCREADTADLSIGEWWFGPRPGSYYVLDRENDTIVAGETGMTLAELDDWLGRHVEPGTESRAAGGSRIAA